MSVHADGESAGMEIGRNPEFEKGTVLVSVIERRASASLGC